MSYAFTKLRTAKVVILLCRLTKFWGGNDVTLWAFFRGIRISIYICIQYAFLAGVFFFCQITFDGTP